MKINNFKINSFGKLKDKEINLDSKINIIYGENEAGKSTVLKFITAILYGLSKNKRGKDISDFEKYTPWYNDEFSGKISYSLDNEKTFEVYREFKKKNPKIYNENLEDISSNFKNDKTKGIEFFEEQTLIDEETFLNTCVIGQEETKLSKVSQANIIQKIGNQISTGDDKISFKKSIEKINKQQLEKIGTTKTSQKPINIIEDNIKKLEKQRQELYEVENKINILKNSNDDIENNLNNEEIKLELFKDYKSKLNENNIKIEQVNFRRDLENEYNEKINKIEEKLKENKIDNKKSKKYILIIEILVVVLLSIISVFTKNIIIAILGIVSLISIIITVIANKKKKQQKVKNKEVLKKDLNQLEENKLEQIELINNKYENEFQEEKEKLINKYKELLGIDFIESALCMDDNELIVATENKEKLINDLKLKQNINKIEIEKLEEAKENLINIEEKLERYYSDKEELEKLNNNYNIAKECLNNAYIKMKNSISPKFKEELSKIINKISNDKYKKIKFDDETGLTVEIENGDYVSADRLSIGTIDQMYLSLRISAIKEISKENMPIILDESFAYYDEKRLENILKYLAGEIENQIIILTCSKREEEILNKLNIQYNKIIL